MNTLPEGFDSIFRYIIVVSQRAEQLITGAKTRQESQRSKPTLTAKDEVDEGLVKWRILTAEELEAQRQAMVEQFRAEVGGEGSEDGRPLPDVLPTAPAPAAPPDVETDDEGHDDEVSRLQRLLGLIGVDSLENTGDEAAEEDGEDEVEDSDGPPEGIDDADLDDTDPEE